MDFGEALAALKDGKRVRRETWATGMWLVLVPASQFEITGNRPLGQAAPHLVGDTAHYRAHLDVCVFSGGVPTLGPWARLDDDVLAEDWSVMPQPGHHQAPTAFDTEARTITEAQAARDGS